MSEKDTKMLHSMSDNRLSEAQDALDKSRNAATVSFGEIFLQTK